MESDERAIGLGISVGMTSDGTAREVPSSKMIRLRYCGDDVRRRINGNVHDRPGEASSRWSFDFKDPSVWGVGFADRRVIVTMNGHEETAIVLDCGIHGRRDSIGVNFVAVGFVVPLVTWVVNEDSV